MIDIGVNLTNAQFSGNVSEILKRAKLAGVEHIIITGTDLKASKEALALCLEYKEHQAGSFPKLFCTAGVHPHDASTWNEETDAEIRKLLNHSDVVAVGETGLDFNRNFSTPKEQISSFKAQLNIACEHNMPLFLHERDAFDTQIKVLKDYAKNGLPKTVIHCFTGNRDNLHAYLDMGFYIGITGWVCDERRGKELTEIVTEIPLDRLMIETDAPYLLPRNITPKPKSRMNEPAHLHWVGKKVAELFELQEGDVQTATTNNATLFFKL